MILDSLLELANATALNTGGAATYLIGSQIDLTVARDIGLNDTDLWLVIGCTTTIASATGTLAFKLASDATAAVHVSTSTVHYVSATFASDGTNVFTAGQNILKVKLPAENPAYEQFLGLLQVTGTAAMTAGAVDAFLTLNPAAWKSHADAI